MIKSHEKLTSNKNLKRGLGMIGVTLASTFGAGMPAAEARKAEAPPSIERLTVLEAKTEKQIKAFKPVGIINGTIGIKIGPVVEKSSDTDVVNNPIYVKRRNVQGPFSIDALKRGDFAFGSVVTGKTGLPRVTLQVFNKDTMNVILQQMSEGLTRPLVEQDTLIDSTDYGQDGGYNYALNGKGKLRMDPEIQKMDYFVPAVPTKVGYAHQVLGGPKG